MNPGIELKSDYERRIFKRACDIRRKQLSDKDTEALRDRLKSGMTQDGDNLLALMVLGTEMQARIEDFHEMHGGSLPLDDCVTCLEHQDDVMFTNEEPVIRISSSGVDVDPKKGIQ